MLVHSQFSRQCYNILIRGESMECSCGSSLVEGKSSYRVSKENFCIIVENIPAFKCPRCEKILFKGDLVERIHKLINKTEREINEIVTGKPSIHSYDY